MSTTEPAPTDAENDRSASFWGLAAPVRGRVVLSGVLAGLGALLGFVPVLAAVELARTLLPGAGGQSADTARVWWLVAGLVAAVVAAQALSSAGYAVSHMADARLAESLRQHQVTQALRLRLDWFARTGSGRIKKIVQDDVAKVHQLVAHVIPDTVNGIVRPVASLTVLFLVDWRLGLISLIPLVLAAASLPLMLKDVTARFTRYNQALGQMTSALVEFIRGIAPVKVFDATGKGHRRFLDSAAEHHRFYRDWMETTVFGSALMLVFTSPVFAIMVSAVGGSLLVVFAGLEPILLLPAILLSANIAGPLYMLMQMRQFMREANGAAREITDFFSLPAAPEADPATAPDGPGVRFDDVTLAYEDGPLALDGVTATLTPGTVTALVGPSGSGKSTFAALVPRLLEPDRGTIQLGGVAVEHLSPRQLYRTVAFVFQEPYLLRLSVRDNIRLARPDANDAEVVSAARAAQIHDRIARLPDGYDTIVGDGARLSGGEQQRLSIARAVLMDAPLLVLDEATAFADPDSEAAIQQALASLTRGRTLLVIAHRLHTVDRADQTLVLEAGRIVQAGPHDDLLAADGLYARMWDTYQRTRDRATRPHISEETR